MELKKKKAEAFSLENEILADAREKIGKDGISNEELRTHFVAMVDEYEKLLDEAKFLTKISDKLESKLNANNEKLGQLNEMLANEAEEEKKQKAKVVEKNKQLFKQTSQLDSKSNKLQLTLVIMVAVLVVAMVFFVYKLYFDTEAQVAKEQQIRAKIEKELKEKEAKDKTNSMTPDEKKDEKPK